MSIFHLILYLAIFGRGHSGANVDGAIDFLMMKSAAFLPTNSARIIITAQGNEQ